MGRRRRHCSRYSFLVHGCTLLRNQKTYIICRANLYTICPKLTEREPRKHGLLMSNMYRAYFGRLGRRRMRCSLYSFIVHVCMLLRNQKTNIIIRANFTICPKLTERGPGKHGLLMSNMYRAYFGRLGRRRMRCSRYSFIVNVCTLLRNQKTNIIIRANFTICPK